MDIMNGMDYMEVPGKSVIAMAFMLSIVLSVLSVLSVA